MGYVLTTGSNITCGHPTPPPPGQVELTGASKLQVSNNPVVVKVGPSLSSPCPLQQTNNTSPCKTATPAGGISQKLKVSNQPVILDSVSVTTDGVPKGAPVVTAAQNKLTAS
jgi:hypothetical protein